MSRGAFDRFMVANDNGRNGKLAKLSDSEFRAFIQGVLPIASEAKPRGAFLIGKLPADADDIVFKAPKVSKRAARSTIDKLRALGMLEPDTEIGGEWVRDFEQYNPVPKTDSTAAERAKRYRDKQKSHATVTPPSAVTNGDRHGSRHCDVTPTEVGSKEDPLTPVTGGPVKFAGKTVPQVRVVAAELLLADFNRKAGTSYRPFGAGGKPTEPFKRIVGALMEHPDITAAIGEKVNTAGLSDPFWEGTPQPGNVWGPGVIDRNLERANKAQARTDVRAHL